MQINVVIFDIGNVLVTWNPEGFFDGQIGASRRKRLFAQVPLEEMNIREDLGEDLDELIPELLANHPDWRAEIEMWRDQWLGMLTPDIPGSAQLLRALRRKGIAVHALSNFGAGTFRLAETRYPVLREFDRRYISGDLKMIKPDPAIYAHVEADLGVPPREILFIDDRPENIAACQARGWQGHLFDTPEALADRLVQENLLQRKEAAL